MNATNYLEAFLGVYGWEVYRMLYLLIALTGLFLYPLLRELLALYLDFLADEDREEDKYLGQAAVIIFSTMLIFFVSVVPFVPVDLKQTKLKTVCETSDTAIADLNPNGDYFKNTETRIPVMPWLAMALGQGVNGVLYGTTPCTLDITNATKAVWNANLDGNPAIKDEYGRFRRECHTRAVNLIEEIEKGMHGEKPQMIASKRISDAVEDYVGFLRMLFSEHKDPAVRRMVVNSLDSQVLQETFYAPAAADHKSLTAAAPVQGYTGEGRDGNPSADAPPTCGDWWNGQGGTLGLRVRLAAALSDSVIQQVVAANTIFSYRSCKGSGKATNPQGQTYWKLTEADMQNCRAEVVKNIFAGKEDALVKKLLEFDQGNFASDTVLSQREKTSLGNSITAFFAASVFSFFSDVDLTGGVLNTVVGFYAGLFMLKLLLKFLLPMVLMTVYIFWGVYLVIARLAMEAVIRGMLLIFALTVMPGIWAVMEHLDDKLWEAMHGDSGLSSPFDMVLLDAASTAFYLASVFIVFYLINLGGGVDSRHAVSGSQNEVGKLSGGFGNVMGANIGRAGANVYGRVKGILSGGLKGGFGRLFGK